MVTLNLKDPMLEIRNFFLIDSAWAPEWDRFVFSRGGSRPSRDSLPTRLLISLVPDGPWMSSPASIVDEMSGMAALGLSILADRCREAGREIDSVVVVRPESQDGGPSDQSSSSDEVIKLFAVSGQAAVSPVFSGAKFPLSMPSAMLRAFDAGQITTGSPGSMRVPRPAARDFWFSRFQDLVSLGLSAKSGRPERVVAVSDGKLAAFVKVYETDTLSACALRGGLSPGESIFVPGGPVVGRVAEPSRPIGPDAPSLCLMQPCAGVPFGWVLRPRTFDTNNSDTLRRVQLFRSGDAGEVRPCIGCLRCSEVCPASISPVSVVRSSDEGSFKVFDVPKRVSGCLACGACSMVCPSKIETARHLFESRFPLATIDDDSRARQKETGSPGFTDGLEEHGPVTGPLRPWTLDPLREAAATFLKTPGRTPLSGPCLRSGQSIKTLMFDVVIALLPILVFSVWLFGPRVLAMIAVSFAVGGAIETFSAVARGEEIHEGFLVTGLILPLTLPPMIPLRLVAAGIAFSVVAGKEVFGGTGRNPFNPALIGRCFLVIAFPWAFSGFWTLPGGKWDFWSSDALTSATPLGVGVPISSQWNLSDLFFGIVPGSVGETSGLLILLGGIFLIYRRTADPRSPLSLVTGFSFVFLMGRLFSVCDTVAAGAFETVTPGFFSTLSSGFQELPRQIFSGGLLFGAFFMATDPVSSSHTRWGRVICGALAGAVAAAIRLSGAYPEGVMFGILVSNAFSPLADEVVLRLSVSLSGREARSGRTGPTGGVSLSREGASVSGWATAQQGASPLPTESGPE